MVAIAKLSVVLSMIMFLDNVLARTSVPTTIGASPAVLPYVNAPNMSSFFPPQTDEWDLGPAAPPRLEELAPVSSSGEFIGKSSSSPAMFNGHITTIFDALDLDVAREIIQFKKLLHFHQQPEGITVHRKLSAIDAVELRDL
ncbi:hypothetical protein SADUNF_Sadunf17G0057400 [Salix dunnii]|uniref:Uncharacterized protein n=1 Tax=Salix dunnii TaxID=1413687 RepID=A0A835J7L1_9ROSI|nr:hypothetical protein SADUNF_Sadunf17G0057400 [Salix dunnii]